MTPWFLLFAAAVVVQPQPKCTFVDSRELPGTLYIGESERGPVCPPTFCKERI